MDEPRPRLDEPFAFQSGTQPLLVSMPHVGTRLTEAVRTGLSAPALELPDTDWHLERLYGFVRGLGASVIAARYSRYVVDLNRPPDDAPLYPTPTPGLFPTRLFDGTALFKSGAEPAPSERKRYLDEIWRPYHARIAAELDRLRKRHGHALLFEAHSIRSRVPQLFEGQLPDFNIGTGDGASAAAELTARLAQVCREAEGFTSVVNGRFKGGYITRHYGRPAERIHAVQLELTQRTYMQEQAPFVYRAGLAEQVQVTLKRFVSTLLEWSQAYQEERR